MENIESVLSIINKVERVNHVDLSPLKEYINTHQADSLQAFSSINSDDSLDTRYTKLIPFFPGYNSDAQFLIEASVLL
ncbi:hypothetical protein L0B53_06200 [Vibrio sp. SS-MA-C1-2]|uniref:hypothetical protein n=1 Tax=Vibrio sp. SS-MA-C1-2 TaxID=2908646 RepID=UPI001F2B9097|nr:hypothetical protein [Vibrio sp. SS-MA-C1-2]UJF19166.1 hypothetical protein L0B53_06200 [Vibrio sp. SS-MA-C1-2]